MRARSAGRGLALAHIAVPFSYYHDKNGVYRAYAQPEMRGAPITVVRKEDQVYIDAYVDFSVANPQKNDPNALKDYEKKIQSAYDSIMETWDTKAAYNLDPLGNDAVTLNTTLHANNPYGQQYGGGVPEGHEAVRINLDENAFLKNVFGASSHVFTVDPKDPYAYDDYLVSGLASGALQSITIPNNRDLSYNLYDALTSQQYEKLLYNWKIENPGQMWLYNPEDAAHEFGHLLGLGDAYGAFYRGGKEADKEFKMTNDYGEEATFTVPKNSGGTVNDEDIMRGGMKGPKRVSDSNVALLANYVWRSGNPYYYNK